MYSGEPGFLPRNPVLQFRGKRISTCQSRGSWRKKNVFCMNNARACYPCESFEQRGLGARSCGWLLEECFLTWTEVHSSTVSVPCRANGCCRAHPVDQDISTLGQVHLHLVSNLRSSFSLPFTCTSSMHFLLCTSFYALPSMHFLLCTHYSYHTSPTAKQTPCSREAL
jgi:hypothetical protein